MIGRKWPRRAKVTAGLALAFGVAAFAMLQGYAARLEASRPDVGAPVAVVVAAADLARGVTLAADMVAVQQVPSAFVPPGALARPTTAVGRVLVSALAQGEAITATRLASPRAGPVAALVPPGFRAFVVAAAVPPDAVRSGDRVDLLATFGGARAHTETVATGLEILEVLDGGETDALSGAPAGATSLVLLVSPDDAERLAYASSFGDLSVTIASADEDRAAAIPSSVPTGG
jgi:pilus assembly protein CpaB